MLKHLNYLNQERNRCELCVHFGILLLHIKRGLLQSSKEGKRRIRGRYTLYYIVKDGTDRTTLIIRIMFYIDKTHGRYGGEAQQAMKAQQMKEARERLTEEFVELLQLSPEDGTRWTGTVTDLVEVVHIAYMQGTVCCDDGAACTFRQLVNTACAILHVKPPCNPRGCAYQAEQRKGVRCRTFLERYMLRPQLFTLFMTD